jgi:hypothetical protein
MKIKATIEQVKQMLVLASNAALKNHNIHVSKSSFRTMIRNKRWIKIQEIKGHKINFDMISLLHTSNYWLTYDCDVLKIYPTPWNYKYPSYKDLAFAVGAEVIDE